MGLLDLSAQINLLRLLLLAVLEICSGFLLINASLSVLLGGTQDWLKKTFAIPLFTGILFISLVIFQGFGFISFDTLQPGTALLFALYAIFAFLLSWNIHHRQS